MNWIYRIRNLLGAFWANLFEGYDFILSVENLHALYGRLREAMVKNIQERLSLRPSVVEQQNAPTEILIDIQKVRKPYAGWASILDGSAKLGDVGTSSIWILPVTDGKVPYYITDSVIDAVTMLIRDVDFVYSGGNLVFYTDPDTLGFSKIKRTEDDGSLHVYYRMFGWYKEPHTSNSTISGFFQSAVWAYAAEAWDVQVNGASKYSAKKLLAAAAGYVICDVTGKVSKVLYEQGVNHVVIGDNVYSSTLPPSVSLGDLVAKGDVIFGDIGVYDATTMPTQDEVPCLRVRTDAGCLFAMNKDCVVTAHAEDGQNILPLEGDKDIVDSYIKRASELSMDMKCPNIEIPSIVNPVKFILGTLRRGKGCIISMALKTYDTIAPAIKILEKNTCAAGIISIFIKTSSGSGTVDITGESSVVSTGVVSAYGDVTVVGGESNIKDFV